MAHQLGISTATFSKYRRIIKLSDDTVKLISELLDDKTITFEAAYLISKLKEKEHNELLKYAVKHKDYKLKMDELRRLSKPLEKGYILPRIGINEYFELRKKKNRNIESSLLKLY